MYGGVAQYNSVLFNDIWLYNYGTWLCCCASVCAHSERPVEDHWEELQASYVPPFPVSPEKRQRPENVPLEQFRPANTPPQPALRDDPPSNKEMVEVQFQPGADLTATFGRPDRSEPMQVIKYTPPEVTPIRPGDSAPKQAPGPGAFLELESKLLAKRSRLRKFRFSTDPVAAAAEAKSAVPNASPSSSAATSSNSMRSRAAADQWYRQVLQREAAHLQHLATIQVQEERKAQFDSPSRPFDGEQIDETETWEQEAMRYSSVCSRLSKLICAFL